MMQGKKKKNVILIMSDSLRRDYLGCYQSKLAKTPNLDKLAAESIIFDRFYVGSYPTIPNRTDLYTGKFAFPFRGWQPLEPEDIILPQILAKHDYTSMLIFDTPPMGVDDYNFTRDFSGWFWVRGQHQDRYILEPNIPTPLLAEPYKLRNIESLKQYLRNRYYWRLERDFMAPKTIHVAMDWLEQNYTRDGFFLWIDMWDPHEPFDPPKHYLSLYGDPEFQGDRILYPAYGRNSYMTQVELEYIKALYAGEVSMVDTWVGYLMDKIDRLGLRKNTLVIFLTDHGHLFGEHKLQGKPGGNLGKLYEPTTRIPLIIRHPEGLGANERVEAIVQPPDIFPTILEFLDVPIPSDIHGKSIWPLVTGKVKKIHDFAFSGRFPRAAGVDVVFDGWAGPDRPGGPITVTDERWAFICTPEVGQSELYDLSADPNQRKNIINNHSDIVNKMLDALVHFFEDLGTDESRIEPLRSFGSVQWPPILHPDERLYVLENDSGLKLAFVDEKRAVQCATMGKKKKNITRQSLRTLQETSPKALVYVNDQYYWADEIV